MNRKFEITDARRGAAFTVRVVTRAQRDEIVGIQEDRTIKIRLKASPADGQANDALIAFLAQRLNVKPEAIEIVAGQDKRDKWVSVAGITTTDVEERLKPDPSATEYE
ncbi:MAG TPA: DUF167 domain-containing protein [Aggregatilineales bacterium]|nr:DUF167 domain-containing protein [Aggregatilineales bacterium]